jgi:hypothetical protein
VGVGVGVNLLDGLLQLLTVAMFARGVELGQLAVNSSFTVVVKVSLSISVTSNLGFLHIFSVERTVAHT